MFEKCLGALSHRGRQVAISSSFKPRVSFNLVDFYHNEARLIGVDTLKLSFYEAAEILRGLIPGFEQGDCHNFENTRGPTWHGLCEQNERSPD